MIGTTTLLDTLVVANCLATKNARQILLFMDQPPLSHTDYIDKASYFIELPGTASAVQVNSLYWFARLELESLIDHTDECSIYGPAWILIGQVGEKNLQAYLRGEDIALERLKDNVANSIRLLP